MLCHSVLVHAGERFSNSVPEPLNPLFASHTGERFPNYFLRNGCHMVMLTAHLYHMYYFYIYRTSCTYFFVIDLMCSSLLHVAEESLLSRAAGSVPASLSVSFLWVSTNLPVWSRTPSLPVVGILVPNQRPLFFVGCYLVDPNFPFLSCFFTAIGSP